MDLHLLLILAFGFWDTNGLPIGEPNRNPFTLPNAFRLRDSSHYYAPPIPCGSHRTLREGDIFYFRNKDVQRPVRNVYWPPSHHPTPYRHPIVPQFPPKGPAQGGTHVPHPQVQYYIPYPYAPPPRPRPNQFIKPRLCEWTFQSVGSCQLVADFEHYEGGDLNCNRQYLLLSDEERELQLCGFTQFPGFFKSFGRKLHIKHFRKPQIWSADFEGFVTCIKYQKGNVPEIIEYSPTSFEISNEKHKFLDDSIIPVVTPSDDNIPNPIPVEEPVESPEENKSEEDEFEKDSDAADREPGEKVDAKNSTDSNESAIEEILEFFLDLYGQNESTEDAGIDHTSDTAKPEVTNTEPHESGTSEAKGDGELVELDIDLLNRNNREEEVSPISNSGKDIDGIRALQIDNLEEIELPAVDKEPEKENPEVLPPIDSQIRSAVDELETENLGENPEWFDRKDFGEGEPVKQHPVRKAVLEEPVKNQDGDSVHPLGPLEPTGVVHSLIGNETKIDEPRPERIASEYLLPPHEAAIWEPHHQEVKFSKDEEDDSESLTEQANLKTGDEETVFGYLQAPNEFDVKKPEDPIPEDDNEEPKYGYLLDPFEFGNRNSDHEDSETDSEVSGALDSATDEETTDSENEKEEPLPAEHGDLDELPSHPQGQGHGPSVSANESEGEAETNVESDLHATESEHESLSDAWEILSLDSEDESSPESSQSKAEANEESLTFLDEPRIEEDKDGVFESESSKKSLFDTFNPDKVSEKEVKLSEASDDSSSKVNIEHVEHVMADPAVKAEKDGESNTSGDEDVVNLNHSATETEDGPSIIPLPSDDVKKNSASGPTIIPLPSDDVKKNSASGPRIIPLPSDDVKENSEGGPSIITLPSDDVKKNSEGGPNIIPLPSDDVKKNSEGGPSVIPLPSDDLKKNSEGDNDEAKVSIGLGDNHLQQLPPEFAETNSAAADPKHTKPEFIPEYNAEAAVTDPKISDDVTAVVPEDSKREPESDAEEKSTAVQNYSKTELDLKIGEDETTPTGYLKSESNSQISQVNTTEAQNYPKTDPVPEIQDEIPAAGLDNTALAADLPKANESYPALPGESKDTKAERKMVENAHKSPMVDKATQTDISDPVRNPIGFSEIKHPGDLQVDLNESTSLGVHTGQVSQEGENTHLTHVEASEDDKPIHLAERAAAPDADLDTVAVQSAAISG